MFDNDDYSKLIKSLFGEFEDYNPEEVKRIHDFSIDQKVQYYLPNNFNKMLKPTELIKKRAYHFENKALNYNTLKIISELNDECLKEKINFVVIKGPALSQLIYNDFSKRIYDDIDIVVSNDDYLKFCFVLEKHGFFNRYAIEYEDYDDTAQEVKSNIYKQLNQNDCAFFHKNLKIRALEIKTLIRECNFEMTNQLISDSILINIDNYTFKTLNLNNTFICILLNLYFFFMSRVGVIHKSKLKDIFDAYSFFQKYSTSIDYNYLKCFADNHKISNKIYFSLLLINQTFKETIPKDIIDLFSTSTNTPMIDIVQCLTNVDKRIENYIYNVVNNSIKNQKQVIKDKMVPRDYDFENASLRNNFQLFRTFNSTLPKLSIKYDFYTRGKALCFVISIPKIINGYTILLNFYDKSDLLKEQKIVIQRYNDNKIIFKNYIMTGTFEHYNNKEHIYMISLSRGDLIYPLNSELRGTIFSIKLYKIITNDVALMGTTDYNEMLSVVVVDN